ncbi:hypothetical protein [Mycobacterium marinum]|uniref:hypothetical protein n=1 Tax=Mycobacterium marinum TaxID=1781 RepID=UPI00115E40B5|nr:hypothetical protein [Mycobacterium marinum]
MSMITGFVLPVAVIFFSELFVGRSSGGHDGAHRGDNGGRSGTCPMMESGEMMGPRGPMGPTQPPTTTAPTTPHP